MNAELNDSPHDAEIFLLLARSFGVDTEMLVDLAHHIELGGNIRGAGGEYSPAQSLDGLGKPLMNIYRLADPEVVGVAP